MHGMMIWKGKLEHRQLAIIFGGFNAAENSYPLAGSAWGS